MAGRWSDERERSWEQRGRGEDGRGENWEGHEERSFDRGGDRVFGERESGAGYNRPQRDVTDYTRHNAYGGGDRPTWQDRDFGGVSPGFRQHERDYDSGYRAYPRGGAERGSGGGRFYGDDGRGRIYREQYAYGAAPSEPPVRRFDDREGDRRYSQALRHSGASFAGDAYGGAGGYDYERGSYGGGERGRDFEDRARDAGEFFRRTGRRVANWFSEVAGEGSEMGRDEAIRDARGRGPKGYKRSDERISDDAHQHLTDDAWLDASDINVAVTDGEITLSGTVETREAKHRAERVVEDLSGVIHVQNNLRVRGAGYVTKSPPNHERTEGDAANETSATATHTTTRRS